MMRLGNGAVAKPIGDLRAWRRVLEQAKGKTGRFVWVQPDATKNRRRH